MSTLLSREQNVFGGRIVENIEMHGDLDFVTTNREVVVRMPHKTCAGVWGDIHTATLCIGGIAVDISTLDGDKKR